MNEKEYTQEEFDTAYTLIRDNLVAGMSVEEDRRAIILGGLPGTGKTALF